MLRPALCPTCRLILHANDTNLRGCQVFPAMRVLCLAVALGLAFAACPQVLSRDIKVLADGYSWLENLLPSGAPLPLILIESL